MNNKQIDLIMTIVREQLDDYLAPALAEDIEIGIRNGIRDNMGALNNLRIEENDREENGANIMERKEAIKYLQILCEYVNEKREKKCGTAIIIHTGHIRAMRRAIEDMKNIEEVNRIINKKEEYDDETAVF